MESKKMQKTIAFIPLRGGSKSIPLKNIKNLCGKPLCFWVLKELEESNVDEIIVATDSSIIKETILNLKFKKVRVYDREDKNAQDASSTEDVMLEYINKNNFNENDLFLLVQATSPFTKAPDFNNALLQLKEEKADSLLSGVITKRFFWSFDGNPINYDYKNRPRRQDFKGFFMENGAFYINSIKNIKDNKNRLSGKIALYEMPEYSSFEIDEEIDWLICEKLMEEYSNK